MARDGSEVVLVGGEAGVGKGDLPWRGARGRGEGTGFRRHGAVRGERRGRSGRWPAALARWWPAWPTSWTGEAFDLVIGNARRSSLDSCPEVGGDPTGEGPIEGTRLCELAVAVFRRLAQRGPLLLVIEDLDWADSTTRTLFSLAGP